MAADKRYLTGVADAFSSVEAHDLKVEKLRMHPSDFADMRKNCDLGTLDLNTNPVIQSDGTWVSASLWGADVVMDKKCQPKHYELISMKGERKDVVCASRMKMVPEDCGDPNCLVEAVHDL